jgi:hypothetical protein
MTSRAGLAAALLTILATGSLAGCGGTDNGNGSSGAEAPKAGGPAETWPYCDQIWVTGETLPRIYQGCVLKGNSVKPFSPEKCASGTSYATYQDRWYAVPGEEIHESKSGDIFRDPAFAKFTARC